MKKLVNQIAGFGVVGVLATAIDFRCIDIIKRGLCVQSGLCRGCLVYPLAATQLLGVDAICVHPM